MLADEDCSIKLVATITGEYAKAISHAMWMAHMHRTQHVMVEERGTPLKVTFPQ